MNTGVLVGVCGGLSLVLFYMMAVVSDSFLAPALVAVCKEHRIPKDVAGATMLAAGASLPELVSNVVSIYVTKTDIGVGTIVGSEIFNHAAILSAVCASSKRSSLDPITCTRDIVGYVGALLLLLVAVSDIKNVNNDDDGSSTVVAIRPVTTVPLVLWYGFYTYLCTSAGRQKLTTLMSPFYQVDTSRTTSHDVGPHADLRETPLLQDDDFDGPYESSVDETEESETQDDLSQMEEDESLKSPWSPQRFFASWRPQNRQRSKRPTNDPEETTTEEETSCLKVVMTLLTAPARAPLWATLPEPQQRPHLAVAISLLWLCLQSFAMVVLLEAAADALHISTAVVGLTVGAVGTSFPNLVSAAAAAQKGSADMAVSASLGANVFNLSCALGLSWILYPIIHPTHPILTSMHDSNLTVLTLGLLFTAIAYAALLVCTRCTLYPWFAAIFLIAYFGFILAALFAEPQLHAVERREHHSSPPVHDSIH